MKNPEYTHYALIQSGYAVFGTGPTEPDAREDAAQWLDGGEEDANAAPCGNESLSHGVNHGDLVVVRCTKALHDEVQANGRGCVWDDTSEGICLPEELEETLT